MTKPQRRFPKSRNWAGYVACICALLFALPHYWFGLGVSFMYPGDFVASFKTAPNPFFVDWLVGTIAVVAAMFGLAFVYPWGDRLPRWFKLVSAWIGCIGLSFWGLNFFAWRFWYAIGRAVPEHFAEALAHPMAVWGYYWYALFLVWGISLGLAAFIESKNRAGLPQRKQ